LVCCTRKNLATLVASAFRHTSASISKSSVIDIDIDIQTLMPPNIPTYIRR
jgi:hypothetical protein